ncbi:MAG TPA: CHAD domain-containing protein [Solirubrobacteraceae bacterium]|jgi:CHAD domain-containing protein|nr:CHAD domain-containing protein [Solirubrobacteraceae bacterium]
MSSNGEDRARLVHEARKTIKRMRAMARLLRHETGEPEFQRINSSLREAGKRLSGARDAEVRIATFAELRSRHPDELAGGHVDALLSRLEQDRATAHGGDPELEVLADVAEMRGDLLRWNLLEHDSDALTAGLRSIYRDGRARYKRVKRSRARDPQRMHDWRKRVKSLYYALDMLGGKQATATAKLTRRADRLGEALGEEHDLWMLASFLESERQLDDGTRKLLLELIERRREQLRKRALRLGASLYARKPDRFAARTGKVLAR